MKILIIGAGNVGLALGQNWTRAGHDVRYGVPNPADPKYSSLPRERLRSAAALDDAEAVVLAVPFPAARAALEALGDLRGRLVLDCTNPLRMGKDGLELSLGFESSAGEQIAGWAAGASVFKTLNQTGAENMAEAHAFPQQPVMFVAGDDAARKPEAMKLVGDLGFQPVDAGPLRISRLLEPFAMLWIDLALKRGQDRDFAFSIIRRN